jgi:hypothetical protein
VKRWEEIQDSDEDLVSLVRAAGVVDDGEVLDDVYRARARAWPGPSSLAVAMVLSPLIILLPLSDRLVFALYLLISVSLGLVPRVNGSRLVALTSGRVLVLRRTWRHRSCVLLRAVAADERTLTVNKFSGLPLYLFANLPTRPYLTRRVAQRVNADRRRLSPVAT